MKRIPKTISLFMTFMKIGLTFMKIGLFTFGGGYAMIPLIHRETVDNKKWISDEDILEIIAIAESTPGPIAINAATFIGYRVSGFWGAFAATIPLFLLSFKASVGYSTRSTAYAQAFWL